MIPKYENSDCFIETKAVKSNMPSMHFHPHYEIYYLESGSREYFVGDNFFPVSVGSFVLIPPTTLHRTGGESDCLRTLIGFSNLFLLETYQPGVTENLLKCFCNYMITPPETKARFFNTVVRHMAECDDRTDFSVWLAILLTELSKCDSNNVCDEYISKIVCFINTNYGCINSIDQIAEHFYISKSHLCRIFKKAMQVTLVDYINNIRIRNACILIDSSDKSMIDIAQLCGFNSSSYFSNVFKKVLGKSPSEYKASFRERP